MARLCVITAAYPSPTESTRAIFLENFLVELERLGFAINVIAPRVHAADPLTEQRRGLSVVRFPYPGAGRRLKELGRVPVTTLTAYMFSGVRRVLRHVRRARPDALYAHWIVPAGAIGAAVSRLTALPLFLHAHGSDVNRYAVASRLTRAVGRWTVNRATAVYGVSRDLVQRMEADLGLPGGRGVVLPMGVDGQLFHPGNRDEARTAVGLQCDRMSLLFVGDLEPAKGILELARRLAENPELASRISLHIIGDGVDRVPLEALAAESGGGVVVHGRVDPDRVALWCRAADLLVLPSRGEGMPLVILEAQRSGLPVLATPVGGIPEVVRDGDTGWLRRIEDFAAQIGALLERPDLLAHAGRALELAAPELGRCDAATRARQAGDLISAALET